MKCPAITLLSLFGLSLSCLAADVAHLWHSADGTKTFRAEYLSQDEESITVKRPDGSKQTFPRDVLHADDLAWLKKQKSGGQQPETSTGTAFDTLDFGDSRQSVQKKLLASKIVTTKVEKTLLARTGLNGIFHTTSKIGDLACFLYFDWDAQGSLKEVTMRSDKVDDTRYDSTVKSAWSELIDLVCILNGKPLQSSSFPPMQNLSDHGFLGSHLWRTAEGNTILLGTGREENEYNVVVRFTSDRIDTSPAP